jgi:hypothetical protein
MTEELLQYLWKFRLYKPGLYSTNYGQPLEIINPGLHNTDAGPDFFNAKIKIGDTLWAGNVEIHQKSSDWNRHGHQTNKAYDNVILHVVSQNDADVMNSSGTTIPAWEMPIEKSHLENYESLLKNHSWVACAPYLSMVHQMEITNLIERMTIEKLQNKMEAIQHLLNHYKNDWDEVFYVLLVRNFGFGINSQPFEQLARQTPWKTVLKNNENPISLEALFLGQAGFLSDLVHEDDYIQTLQLEYRFLAQKHNLSPIAQHHWKFLRLRPSNFPTIRLAQLAQLFHKNTSLFSRILATNTIESLLGIFNINASEYWNTHYRPGAESNDEPKHIGKSSAELLVINTIIPLLFAYGKLRDSDAHCQKALNWLEALKPEQNNIIKGWAKIGIKATNAAQSQGLVFLKQNLCLHRKCLHCRIGHLVISKKTG